MIGNKELFFFTMVASGIWLVVESIRMFVKLNKDQRVSLTKRVVGTILLSLLVLSVLSGPVVTHILLPVPQYNVFWDSQGYIFYGVHTCVHLSMTVFLFRWLRQHMQQRQPANCPT